MDIALWLESTRALSNGPVPKWREVIRVRIDLTDLKCERVAVDVFHCVASQASPPGWFYPVVLACFFIALAVLALVARITLKQGKTPDRRQVNRYVENERRRNRAEQD